MKKFAMLLILAGLAGGCLETQTKPKTPTTEAKKPEETVVSKVPVVTPESLNEMNAPQRAQALLDEIKGDGPAPAKAVADARK